MDKEDKKEIVGMFEHISEKMDKGFGEIHSEINGIHSEMNGIHSEMNGIHSEMNGIHSEIKNFRNETSENFREVRKDISNLRTDLEMVEQTTESNRGFSKEIDILFSEVKNIKEHIGLKEAC